MTMTMTTVLIVEDDKAIRRLVRQALEGEGHRAVEAGDGAAALALLEREEGRAVDLVLLDLWMPVMDGVQFAAAYHALDDRMLPDGHAPLVVFTADPGRQAAQYAERLKAVGYLTKPFDIDDLLAVVGRCARRRGDAARREEATAPKPVVMVVPAATAAATAAREKLTREEVRRQQAVARLKGHLQKLQADMDQVRLEVTKVVEIEATRRLSREEARRASRLRMEGERLGYELQILREEFFRLKDERTGG